jgi:hypothetical protein
MARKPLTEEQKAARNANARAKRAQIRAAANKVNESAATSNGSPTSGPISHSRPAVMKSNVPAVISNGTPQQELVDENDNSGSNAKLVGSSLATIVNSKPIIQDRINNSPAKSFQDLGIARRINSNSTYKNLNTALNGAPTQTATALNPAQKITDTFAGEAKANSSNKQNMGSSKDGGTKPWWDKMNDTLDDINKDIKTILELLKHMKGSPTGIGAAQKNGSDDGGKSDWLSGLSKMLGTLGTALGALLAAKFGGVAAQLLGALNNGFKGFLNLLKGGGGAAEEVAKDARNFGGLGDTFNKGKKFLGDNLNKLKNNFNNSEEGEGLLGKIKGGLNKAGAFVRNTSDNIMERVRGFAADSYEKTGLSKAVSSARNLAGNIAERVGSSVESAKDFAGNIAEKFSGFTENAGKFANGASNIISKTSNAVGKVAGPIAGAVGKMGAPVLRAIGKGTATVLGGTAGKLLGAAAGAARFVGGAEVAYHGGMAIYDAAHGNTKGAVAQGLEASGNALTFFGDKLGKFVPAAGPVGAFAKTGVMMATNALGNVVSGIGENIEARTPAEKAAAQKKMGRGGGVLAGMGAGAAAGAAIGSVVPIVGTALGAVAGSTIGGGLAIGEQFYEDHGAKGIKDAAGNILNKAKGAVGATGAAVGAVVGSAAGGIRNAAMGVGSAAARAAAAGAGGIMAAGGVLANGARAVGAAGAAIGVGGAAMGAVAAGGFGIATRAAGAVGATGAAGTVRAVGGTIAKAALPIAGLGGAAIGAIGNIFKGHDAEAKSGVPKSAALASVKQSTNTMYVTAQTLNLNARESTASAAMKAAPVTSGGGKGGVNINQTITVNQKIDTVNNTSPAELKKAMAKFMQTMAANEARIKGQMEQYTQNIGNQLNNPFNSVVAAIANAGSMGGW